MSPAEARAAITGDEFTTDAEVAAAVIGIPKSSLYTLCREGKSPIEPIRCGRTLRFRSDQLRGLVGL